MCVLNSVTVKICDFDARNGEKERHKKHLNFDNYFCYSCMDSQVHVQVCGLKNMKDKIL